MKIKALASPERVALAVLALLAVAALLIPWSEFAPGKGRFLAVHRLKTPTSVSGPVTHDTVWQADVEYKQASGTLSIGLQNKHDSPAKNLALRAQFSSGGSRKPAVRTWLREQSDGRYQASDIALSKGKWLLTLTGWQNSQFQFSLERPVTIP